MDYTYDSLFTRFVGWTTFALHHPIGRGVNHIALASCFTDDSSFLSEDIQPSYTISCHLR